MVGLINNRKNTDVKVLLMVYARATCMAGSVLNPVAMDFSTLKNGNIIITPTTLNKVLERATSLESEDIFMLTNKAVEVVPMFAPITTGMAMSMVMVP